MVFYLWNTFNACSITWKCRFNTVSKWADLVCNLQSTAIWFYCLRCCHHPDHYLLYHVSRLCDYVLAMLSDDGNLKPKNDLKIFWGVLLATIAIVLLLSGGLVALQNTLIIVAFPFSLIMGTDHGFPSHWMLHEKDKMGLSITPTRYPKKDQPFKSYEE